ncbi:MAG TPA: sigma factor-like helix-turn-helix DNA-binding protein, partial [Candidatus Ozemobacteraceae bacterium]|nr:sigma factor-like helix-turn-helix DNA-binding protein [Candidatus Ozemobacteraceae bacterium]
HLMRTALAQLSEAIREAFLLKHFAELTFVEVAEIQGVPVATAKSRVLFAIRKLRELIGDDHDD